MAQRRDKFVVLIALFKRCFHWAGLVTPKRLHTILTSCKHLTELHLSPKDSFNENPITEHPDELGSNTLAEIFSATRESYAPYHLGASLSAEHIKVLGESNPELQSFSAKVGPDAVKALMPLLASHCRKIRTLHPSFQNPDSCEQQDLPASEWRSLAAASCRASNELRKVTVECRRGQVPSETVVDELVDTIFAVLQHLVERATIVCFQVPVANDEFQVMIDKLCRLLDTVADRYQNLKDSEYQDPDSRRRLA